MDINAIFNELRYHHEDEVVDEDWSKEIVEVASIDDLDKEAVALAREGYKQRYPKLAKACITRKMQESLSRRTWTH